MNTNSKVLPEESMSQTHLVPLGSTAAGFGAIRGVDETTSLQDQNREKSLEDEYEGYANALRKKFATGDTKSISWRIKQLENLKSAWIANKEKVFEALENDLGRPRVMTTAFEYANIIAELNLNIRKVKAWAKPKKVYTGLGMFPAVTKVHYEPKGVILCIGPWNFPFVLTIIPLINMIAAGNCVIMKPSELSVHSSKVVTDLIETALDKDAFRVVNGAVPETTALLSRKWDHIMYTGNGMVGKIVMKAAAEHLTPVTLELGGKSPVYVDESADLEMTASRLVGAKICCTGQVCIAPDYVLVHKNVREKFLKLVKKELVDRLGAEPREVKECGKIINQRHWDRVASLLKDNHEGEVLYGGLDFAVREEKYFPTTVVVEPNATSRIMQEEIFGPLLPVLTVKSASAAIHFINARDKPLALYVFASSNQIQNDFTSKTSSGGMTINDCIYHGASSSIPFGGVGAAGMGGYKGLDGFTEFSHKKGVVKRGSLSVSKLQVRSENEWFLDWISTMLNKFGWF